MRHRHLGANNNDSRRSWLRHVDNYDPDDTDAIVNKNVTIGAINDFGEGDIHINIYGGNIHFDEIHGNIHIEVIEGGEGSIHFNDNNITIGVMDEMHVGG